MSTSASSNSPSNGTSKSNEYTIIREIDSGGFSKVYSATIGARTVALKRQEINMDTSEREIDRLTREYAYLQLTMHSSYMIGINECNVIFSMDRKIYVQYELPLRDCSLTRIINSDQPLSYDHIKYIFYQITLGIDFLHENRIVHRDLKPGNILIDEYCNITICDLGAATELIDDTNTVKTFLYVGDFVMAMSSMDNSWYDARIRKDNGNDTYNIVFGDGTPEDNIPKSRITYSQYFTTSNYRDPKQTIHQTEESTGKHTDIWALAAIIVELYPLNSKSDEKKSVREKLFNYEGEDIPKHLNKLVEAYGQHDICMLTQSKRRRDKIISIIKTTPYIGLDSFISNDRNIHRDMKEVLLPMFSLDSAIQPSTEKILESRLFIGNRYTKKENSNSPISKEDIREKTESHRSEIRDAIRRV
jgi:serine/threonine protein kinase